MKTNEKSAFSVSIPAETGREESFKILSCAAASWVVAPLADGETAARREAVPAEVRDEARATGATVPAEAVLTRGFHMIERALIAPGPVFRSDESLRRFAEQTGLVLVGHVTL